MRTAKRSISRNLNERECLVSSDWKNYGSRSNQIALTLNHQAGKKAKSICKKIVK